MREPARTMTTGVLRSTGGRKGKVLAILLPGHERYRCQSSLYTMKFMTNALIGLKTSMTDAPWHPIVLGRLEG